MGIIQERQVSSRRIEANQRNALKSTGPRTAEGKRRSSLNASKHGLCADSFCRAMRSLGEDPREFERLHQDLVNSCQPANALEAKLVEDLAILWWKKARAERAQAGVQIQQVRRERLERLRELYEINRRSEDEPRDWLAVVGLLRGKDCKGKFEDILLFLDVLMDSIKRGETVKKAEGYLEAMYGVQPTFRGSLILSYLRRLKQPSGQPAQGMAGPEGAAPSADSAASGASESSIRSSLVSLLRQERTQVAGQYELFLREHRTVPAAARDACLAPTDARWTWILRMDNHLDRQIERKLRMLLRLQSLHVGPSADGQAAGQSNCGRRSVREKKDTKNAKTKPPSY